MSTRVVRGKRAKKKEKREGERAVSRETSTRDCAVRALKSKTRDRERTSGRAHARGTHEREGREEKDDEMGVGGKSEKPYK